MSIKIEKTEVVGWEHAIRGMRNPKNSWDRMDSRECAGGRNYECENCEHDDRSTCEDIEIGEYIIGPNDHKLMMNLAAGGPVHAKYRRMITVYVDITAPLYWWKEFDTYKVGTVANSCSTMHKIDAKEFELSDFSLDHAEMLTKDIFIQHIIPTLNIYRKLYCGIESGDRKGEKSDWWQMIQLLPSSYNQKRTIMLNYEVLAGIYPMRKGHKLDEWHDFCDWIESLPYSEIITGERSADSDWEGK